jgi:hypothetical protein
MPVVFVIGSDWTLRAGVRAELLEAGVQALGFESAVDASAAVVAGTLPEVIVVDASSADAAHPALRPLSGRVPILVVTPGLGGEPVPEAALVLRRPVRIAEIVDAVRQILRGHAA